MPNGEIGTKIKLTGEKEFNAQMKAMNNGLKTVRSDMAALSAEFDGNTDSIEALTAKQKVLQESVDQHKAKVAALKTQYEAAVSVYGETSAAAQKYRQQLNFATVALQKETAALEKNAAALKETEAEGGRYVPITQRMANSVKDTGDRVKDFAARVSEASRHVPVLAEFLDVAKVSAAAFGSAANVAGTGAKVAINGAKGIGAAAGGLAKGVGLLTAASAAGVAAIGAGGVIAVSTMARMAREAADAAKAAQEAGETLTESQQMWLGFSDQLDALDASVANAKSALGGVLLPALSELSEEGAALLNSFTADMEAAAGDTEKQGQVLARYIAQGAKLIRDKLPEYVAAGKELFAGIGEGLSESGPELMDMGLDLVMELLDGIIENAPELAQAGLTLIQRLAESLIKRGPDLTVSSVDMVTQIVTGLAQAAPQLIPAAAQLVSQLLRALISSAPDLLQAGMELILGIISGLIAGIGTLIGASDEVIDATVAAFLAKADEFLAVGGQIVDRIKGGIAEAWESFKAWFLGIWDSLFGNLNVDVGVNNNGKGVDGSHAGGLDYVPFDGYLAQLHRGEMILTSAEAANYRRERTSGNAPKIVNLTFNAKTITEADVNMVVDIVNRKLGDDL